LPSGSGKTTILMLIAGFDALNRGRICVDGRDITGQPPEPRNFGIVFQGYALFPHMSVLDNVAFLLRMKRVGASKRQRRASKMLAKVDLHGLGSRRPTSSPAGSSSASR
jgi:ABC-type Fe3+/spermidine/putrescine transport system ATPase subunit